MDRPDPNATTETTTREPTVLARVPQPAATMHAGGGAPHVRPVFAVLVEGRLYSTTNGARAKARDLAADLHIVLG
jgi:hypothetical protein